MAERPRVIRSDDPVRLAATRLADAVAAVDRARGAARLAIPGGSALAAVGPAREALGGVWSRVRLTWVDERCVPFDDDASNRGTAYREGALDPDHPPADELPLHLDDESGEASVVRVEAGITGRFEDALDVLLLGMGEDGHVASLFPGFDPPPGARVAHVRSAPKPPPERITLTRRLLATAAGAVLLATGEAKRAALERLVRGDPRLPASGLAGLTLVTDLDLGRER